MCWEQEQEFGCSVSTFVAIVAVQIADPIIGGRFEALARQGLSEASGVRTHLAMAAALDEETATKVLRQVRCGFNLGFLVSVSIVELPAS